MLIVTQELFDVSKVTSLNRTTSKTNRIIEAVPFHFQLVKLQPNTN